MKFVGLTSKKTMVLQWQMRDFQHALRECGHSLDVIFDDEIKHLVGGNIFVSNKIESTARAADMVFALSEGRSCMDSLFDCGDKPAIIWDQDQYLFDAVYSDFRPDDRLFSITAVGANIMARRGVLSHALPCGYNETIYMPLPDAKREAAVFFAGSIWPGGFIVDWVRDLPRWAGEIIYQIEDPVAMKNWTGDIYEKIPALTGGPAHDLPTTILKRLEYIFHECHRAYWIKGLIAAGLPLHLYGRNMANFAGGKYEGTVANGAELNQVHNQYAIALDIHESFAWHFRLFEQAASGCAILSTPHTFGKAQDWIPSAITCETPQEMADTARRLLETGKWRELGRACAEEAKYHTLTTRIEPMLHAAPVSALYSRWLKGEPIDGTQSGYSPTAAGKPTSPRGS